MVMTIQAPRLALMFYRHLFENNGRQLTVTNCVGDQEQVRLERVEAQTSEDQCQVLSERNGGDLERQAQHVQGPQIVVAKTLPEQLEGYGLAVVHARLGWVFPKNAVDHDGLFPFCEPTLLASEPIRGLARPSRHQDKGKNANNQGHEPFNQEEPAPTGKTVDASHAEQTKTQQG